MQFLQSSHKESRASLEGFLTGAVLMVWSLFVLEGIEVRGHKHIMELLQFALRTLIHPQWDMISH